MSLHESLASSYKISYLEPMKVIPADMRKHIGGFGSHRDFVHSVGTPNRQVRILYSPLYKSMYCLLWASAAPGKPWTAASYTL